MRTKLRVFLTHLQHVEISSEDEREDFDVSEEKSRRESLANIEDEDGVVGAYAQEPLADEEWLQEYNKRQQKNKEEFQKLSLRLDGTEPVNIWCKCGFCDITLLENPRECHCCREIEKCVDALKDPSVLQSVESISPCITNHPGFIALCLNRWSLRMTADVFKTRDGYKYRQIGPKERFLRGVAYRQFTKFGHGRLYDKRIPLPACAYNAIRSEFKVTDNFKGYEELDDELYT